MTDPPDGIDLVAIDPPAKPRLWGFLGAFVLGFPRELVRLGSAESVGLVSSAAVIALAWWLDSGWAENAGQWAILALVIFLLGGGRAFSKAWRAFRTAKKAYQHYHSSAEMARRRAEAIAHEEERERRGLEGIAKIEQGLAHLADHPKVVREQTRFGATRSPSQPVTIDPWYQIELTPHVGVLPRPEDMPPIPVEGEPDLQEFDTRGLLSRPIGISPEVDRLEAERKQERRIQARDEYRKGIGWGQTVEQLLVQRRQDLEVEVAAARARLEEFG